MSKVGNRLAEGLQRARQDMIVNSEQLRRMTHRDVIVNNEQLGQIIRAEADVPETNVQITPHNTLPIDRVANAQKVALVLGGGADVFAEYAKAREMCTTAGREVLIIACNDMIALFPEVIDHAVTLHPEYYPRWLKARKGAGFPPLTRIWSHRSYVGFTDHTKDWTGSSGLMCIKIAREIGCTHIILCGVPMTPDGEHFVRHQRWQAAHGFRRGWGRHVHSLKPFVRSMSGWTRENFGYPTYDWLVKTIDDPYPMHPQPVGIKA